jgi:CRP/FNR family transcriptional regulator
MSLEKFSFYKKLEPEAIEFLEKNLEAVKVPKDTLLFSEGDVCDSILFLTSGEVQLIQEEKQNELYRLYPGDQCIVNTASTLSQTPAIASAITQTEIEGYILDMYSVKILAKNSEPYLSYLFEIYTLNVTGLANLNFSALHDLDSKIVGLIRSTSDKSIKNDIAALATSFNVPKESVARILKSLQNDNIITIDDDMIRLV